MPKLIYSFLASLDGYVADDAGGFDWAVPDEEVLDFINAVERDVGTYLYGRVIAQRRSRDPRYLALRVSFRFHPDMEPYRGETALLNPDMAPCREGAEAGGCSVRGRVGRCGA